MASFTQNESVKEITLYYVYKRFVVFETPNTVSASYTIMVQPRRIPMLDHVNYACTIARYNAAIIIPLCNTD